MRRVLALTTLAAAFLSGRAQAIEMFTNFNNGQNIGFPPLEVPTRIYGGFGRGGWNPHAVGTPLKTNPPVPATMPTGQLPPGRFNYYAAPTNVFTGTGGTTSQQQLVGDRRHGRLQRGNAARGNGLSGGLNAKLDQDSDSVTQSSRRVTADLPLQAEPKPIEQRSPTILHAESGELYNSDASRTELPREDSFQDWPKADALFPR